LNAIGHATALAVARGAVRSTSRPGGRGLAHLVVKHPEVLTPAAGRLSFEVRLPIAHDPRSDTKLQRQAETGSNFLF